MRIALDQGAPGPLAGSPLSPIHLRVVDLHKRYGTQHVLRGVSFEVQRGMTNVIVGRSGSGKTVLLRLDMGHRVNLLEEGQIVFSGTCDEFFHTEHALARAFVRASGVEERSARALARP